MLQVRGIWHMGMRKRVLQMLACLMLCLHMGSCSHTRRRAVIPTYMTLLKWTKCWIWLWTHYKIACSLVEIHAQMHSFPMKFVYFLHVHIQWWHWHSVPTQTWFCASGCGLLFRQCGKGGGGRELCRATSGPAKFWIIHRCNITSCIIAQMLGLVTNMVMSVWASVSLFTTWPYLTKKNAKSPYDQRHLKWRACEKSCWALIGNLL